MQDNSDFKQTTVRNVSLQWPRLTETFRYNKMTNQSEPCPPMAHGAAYSVSFDMPMDTAKKFLAEAAQHYESCRQRNPDLPPFTRIFGAKKSEDAKSVRFTAKRKGSNSKGKQVKPPRVIDAAHRDLADPNIWSGSVGDVAVSMFPALDAQTNEGGISLTFNAVLVRQAVYGGANMDEIFGPAEEVSDDGWQSDRQPPAHATAVPPAQPAPKPAPAPVASDLEF